jgi:tetratricopeptide (TPR) repeat protein
MPPTVLEKWDGILDRLCQMDDSDADAIERGFPGLAAMSAPMADAYNRDEPALRRSLAISLATLSRYEAALSGKMLAQEREGIHGLLAIGHLLNAMALATTGRGAMASTAMETSLHHLRKAPSVANAPEFQMFEALASWIYAKAGMHDKAMKAIRKSLTGIDRMRKRTGGDKATTIATAIETLRVLESPR